MLKYRMIFCHVSMILARGQQGIMMAIITKRMKTITSRITIIITALTSTIIIIVITE